MCAAVYRWRHLVKATKVNAGLAESNGRLLLGIWRDSLHVICGLTASTPGSAPGPTLGNEYGKTLPFTFYTASAARPSLHCPHNETPQEDVNPPCRDTIPPLVSTALTSRSRKLWFTLRPISLECCLFTCCNDLHRVVCRYQ